LSSLGAVGRRGSSGAFLRSCAGVAALCRLFRSRMRLLRRDWRRYGQPAAAPDSAEELASLDETVDILSIDRTPERVIPGALADIRQAEAEIHRGECVTAEEMSRILAGRHGHEHPVSD